MSAVSALANGRWPGILTSLGIDDHFLKNKHGECPLCGGKDRFRFDDQGGRGSYFCSHCGAGDGFSLVQKFRDWSFAETAKNVEAVCGKCAKTPALVLDTSGNQARLRRIHAGLKRISHNDPVGRYLLGRGIKILPERDVYFHPGVDYFDKKADGTPVKIGTFPAMVAAFRDRDDKLCTYHVTYLTPEGTKLGCDAPKKILPKIRDLPGGAIRLSDACKILGVAEGIETALAAQQYFEHPVWAASNAGLLEKITIPSGVKKVVIFADEDMSFTGQKSAYVLAHRLAAIEKLDVEVVRFLGKEGSLFRDNGGNHDFCDFINS